MQGDVKTLCHISVQNVARLSAKKMGPNNGGLFLYRSASWQPVKMIHTPSKTPNALTGVY
jgi:hypothetical protein